MSKGSGVGDELGELVVKFTCFGYMFTRYIYRAFSELNFQQNKARSVTLGYFRAPLPKHRTEIGTNRLFKVVSILQVSPALLKYSSVALSSRRKKSAVSSGSRISALGAGLKASLQVITQYGASGMPTSWQVLVARWIPPTGAELLKLCPILFLPFHRSRAKNILSTPGKLRHPREG
jgi:hypothetical protein